MLFDSSLRKELARTFGGTLAVILTIVLTMMLIRVLGQAAGGSVSPQDVVLLLGYTALAQLPTILNLSLFVSVVATLTRMYRDSEMVIWFASGVSLVRMVRPVMAMAWPVLTAVAVLLLAVWPWSNQQVAELRDRYQRRSDLSRVTPGQFQVSGDGRRVFFIDKDDHEGQQGHNVFILASQGERESVTTALSGEVELEADGDRYLVLSKGARTDLDLRTSEKTLSRFEQYRVRATDKALGDLNQLPPRAQTTLDLLEQRKPAQRGELAWRLGLSIAAGNLVLLGLGLAAGNPRRAGSWNLLFALLTFVVYFNLINLSQAWVSAGRLGLGAVLLGLHGSVAALGGLLLLWRDRGTAPLWRLRTAPARGTA